MTNTPYRNRLHRQLAYVIALEGAIEQTLDTLLPTVSEHAATTSMFSRFRTVARDQRQSLVTRLEALAGDASGSGPEEVAFAADTSSGGNEYPVSTALQTLYTLLNQVIIGYSTLQPISHRFRESRVIGEEGTVGDLAKAHTPVYVGAIAEISRLLHDVVLWELDREGIECRCTCPSCGLGVCLCALSSRKILRDAWLEAGPIADDEGIYVHPPRKDSAAAKAGLHSGDVIVSIGNEEIEAYGELQIAVQNNEPGGKIQLTVRRGSGDLEEISVA